MSLSSHDSAVREIAKVVADCAASGEPVHLFKGGVSHFVPMPGDNRRQGKAIDISGLRNILEIDAASLVCIAEPGVTFAELARATLEQGLIPMVVPELDGIKTLISQNHYTQEQFWNVYNRENYESAKRALDPRKLFPGVYEKFHRKPK